MGTLYESAHGELESHVAANEETVGLYFKFSSFRRCQCQNRV